MSREQHGSARLEFAHHDVTPLVKRESAPGNECGKVGVVAEIINQLADGGTCSRLVTIHHLAGFAEEGHQRGYRISLLFTVACPFIGGQHLLPFDGLSSLHGLHRHLGLQLF